MINKEYGFLLTDQYHAMHRLHIFLQQPQNYHAIHDVIYINQLIFIDNNRQSILFIHFGIISVDVGPREWH